jgi:hypothetical protein
MEAMDVMNNSSNIDKQCKKKKTKVVEQME